MSLEDQIEQLNVQVHELKSALETKVDVLEKLLFLSTSPASIVCLDDYTVTERYIQLKSGSTHFRFNGWGGPSGEGYKIEGVAPYSWPAPRAKDKIPESVKEVVAALAGAGMNIRCVE